MQLSLREIAKLVGGKVEGDQALIIDNVAALNDANPSALSFLANSSYEKYLYSTQAGAVLVSDDFNPKEGKKIPTIIRVADAYSTFAVILEHFERTTLKEKSGIEEPIHLSESVELGNNVYLGAFSYISENVDIGDDVKIYPQVYIGEGVSIGKGTVIFPGVKIYGGAVIGNYCTIEAGAVIGGEGFGFASQDDGSMRRIPQIGNVSLGDHVSIGANTTIDRATFGSTRIASGVKLDNLVQVGHNVSLGKNTAIAAQAGIAGSTTIGENCMFGGQVGIVGHLEVASNTKIAPKGGVMSSIKEEGRVLLGAPVMDFSHTKKVWVIWRKLPELQKRLEKLEKSHKG